MAEPKQMEPGLSMGDHPLSFLQGTVERVTYLNEETGYIVARLEVPGRKGAERAERGAPATLTGIEKSLGFGLIKGIGPIRKDGIVKSWADQREAVQPLWWQAQFLQGLHAFPPEAQRLSPDEGGPLLISEAETRQPMSS